MEILNIINDFGLPVSMVIACFYFINKQSKWIQEELEEDIVAQVAARAAELEAQHDGDLLEELVQNGGFKRGDAAGHQQNRVVDQTT